MIRVGDIEREALQTDNCKGTRKGRWKRKVSREKDSRTLDACILYVKRFRCVFHIDTRKCKAKFGKTNNGGKKKNQS